MNRTENRKLGAVGRRGNTVAAALRRLAVKAVGTVALSAVALAANAAGYPEQTIQMIISFPPGGATDVLARELSQQLGATLGQTVIVVNRPGAGALIGMQAAARSTPDGYTLYISSVMSNAVYEAINGKPDISLDKDFDPIGAIASAPHILVTPSNSGIKDMPSLVKFLKADPGKYNYASMGAGTLSNMEAEIFKEQTGVQALQIPYKGSSQALPEVITGSSTFMFDSITSSLPQKVGGRINVLGVASANRLSVIPEVPTLKELGVAGLEAENLFALLAPKGMPQDRVQIVAAALKKAKENAVFRKAIAAQGFEISQITDAALMPFIVDQQAFWLKTVKSLNITATK